MVPKVEYGLPDIEQLRKRFLVADLHFHTAYSHDCDTSVTDILDRAEKMGILVAITDHNRIGGVLEAHSTPRGRKLVIPGIEVTTQEGKDVLVYFYRLDDLKRFYDERLVPHLKSKSSIRSNRTQYSIHQLLPDLQDWRCVVVLPHPVGAKMRASFGYLQRNRQLLKHIHAIEVINETMTHKNNLTALGWSVQLSKPMTAGSDGHQPRRLGEAVTAAKVTTKEGLLDAIKEGKTVVAGQEMRMLERVTAYANIIRQKARLRQNRKLDQSS